MTHLRGTLITWTLTGEFIVHGEVTGFQYEQLVGAEVTVENKDSGGQATATVEEDGTHSVDLGDTSNFSSGYSIGDEIHITVKHRDTERTWIRYVEGAEIEQDLHFTHGTWKLALNKAKLLTEEVITGETGTQAQLRNADTKVVTEVTLNDAQLASSDWEFRRPNKLNLQTELSSSDVLVNDGSSPEGIEIKMQTHPERAQVWHDYYNRSIGSVNDTAGSCTTPPVDGSDTIQIKCDSFGADKLVVLKIRIEVELT